MFTIRAGDGIPFPLKTGHAQSGGISSVLSVVNPDEEVFWRGDGLMAHGRRGRRPSISGTLRASASLREKIKSP